MVCSILRACLAGSASASFFLSQLKDAVCSPGGSTIAGVHSLEDDKFRGTIMNAIQATLNKVKELG